MTNTIPQGTWLIDSTHSEINFSVKHLMISKVRGDFSEFSGKIVTRENPENTTVQGNIQTASLSTNDANRDTHLRSEDFFNVDTFPEITFESTNIAHVKNDDYLLHGKLTIKGETRIVELKLELGGIAVDPYGQTKVAASAVTKISRADFGLTWNVALETGGVLVGDEITITLDIQATLQQ